MGCGARSQRHANIMSLCLVSGVGEECSRTLTGACFYNRRFLLQRGSYQKTWPFQRSSNQKAWLRLEDAVCFRVSLLVCLCACALACLFACTLACPLVWLYVFVCKQPLSCVRRNTSQSDQAGKSFLLTAHILIVATSRHPPTAGKA